jgi:hypothetical protein
MSKQEDFLGYTIQPIGKSGKLGVALTRNPLSHNGVHETSKVVLGKESLADRIVRLECLGQATSLLRDALNELCTAEIREREDACMAY